MGRSEWVDNSLRQLLLPGRTKYSGLDDGACFNCTPNTLFSTPRRERLSALVRDILAAHYGLENAGIHWLNE
jgi:hypothetical protein